LLHAIAGERHGNTRHSPPCWPASPPRPLDLFNQSVISVHCHVTVHRNSALSPLCPPSRWRAAATATAIYHWNEDLVIQLVRSTMVAMMYVLTVGLVS
jgi:hypothetical protein